MMIWSTPTFTPRILTREPGREGGGAVVLAPNAWLPHRVTAPEMKRTRPIVASTLAAVVSGLNRLPSIWKTTPTAGPTANTARAALILQGMPARSTSAKNRRTVTVASDPCAKFKMREVRYVRTRPTAASEYTEPLVSPITTNGRYWFIISPGPSREHYRRDQLAHRVVATARVPSREGAGHLEGVFSI